MVSRLTFRHYLLISILALSGFPILILGAYHFQEAFQAVERRSAQVDQLQSQAFAHELKAQLETRVEVVKALAASATDPLNDLLPLDQDAWGSKEEPSLARLQSLVDGVRARSNYFDFMYIARLRGESLAISPLRSPEGRLYLGANYRDRDYFQALIAAQAVSISQVQLGKRSQKPNIQIVAPIFSKRTSLKAPKLIGLSEGSVDLEIMIEESRSQFQNQRALNPDETVETRLLVLDHQDQVLIDTSDTHHVLTPFKPLTQRPKGEVLVDGERAWRKSERSLVVEGDLKWRVLILRDNDSLRYKAFKEALSALLPSVALMMIIWIAALLFSRRLSRDIGTLEESLKQIERGDDLAAAPSLGPHIKIKEWVELFQTAHELSMTLRSNRSALERSLIDQREINDQQSSLLKALEHVREGIEIINVSGETLYANSTARQRAQLSKLELTETHLLSLKRGETLEVEGSVEIDSQRSLEHITLSPQLNQGTLERVVIIRRDITQERERQEILKVNERLNSLSSLAAGVTHEINNPLMYILANLNFVINGLEQRSLAPDSLDEMTSLLRQSREGAEQIRAVAEALQHIGSRSHKPTWHELSTSVHHALRLAHTEIKHQSELIVEINTSSFFYGSNVKLSQALIQLIKNGLHAMQATKAERSPLLKVSVSEIRSSKYGAPLIGVIEVTDNGSGIAESVSPHLFEPFFTTKPRAVGTGLGLAICQQIVHDMGGHISFESRSQRTTFRIEIPLMAELPEGVSPLKTAPIEVLDQEITESLSTTFEDRVRRSEDSERFERPRVLVVDDVEAITKLISRQLKRRYQVWSANNGADALKLIQQQDFDVILSDVMMPQMSGVELYMSALAQWPEVGTRFVFMTGGVLDEDDQQFFADHSVVCLSKPCQRSTLINEIESCLHSQAS